MHLGCMNRLFDLNLIRITPLLKLVLILGIREYKMLTITLLDLELNHCLILYLHNHIHCLVLFEQDRVLIPQRQKNHVYVVDANVVVDVPFLPLVLQHDLIGSIVLFEVEDYCRGGSIGLDMFDMRLQSSVLLP